MPVLPQPEDTCFELETPHYVCCVIGNMAIAGQSTVLAVGSIVTICLPMHAQTSATAQDIPVTGIRGIAEALDHLQQNFQKPINYEQLPLESLVKPQNETPKRLLVDPATAFTPIPGASRSPYLAAQSVLAAYRNTAEPGVYGVYRVLWQPNQVNVLPIQVLATNGSLRNVTPLMSRPISFPAAMRFLGDTVQSITDAISKESGFNVFPIGIPGFPLEQVELDAKGESAADVIAKLSARLNRPISFRCVFDPSAKKYYVALRAIAPPNGSHSP